MRGLTTSNGGSSRSKSTCSFCKSPDHQVGKCPHIVTIKESLDKGIIPLEYMATVSSNKHDDAGYWRQSDYWRSPLSTWYSRGENWGDLYKQTYKAFAKWERAQERAKTKGWFGGSASGLRHPTSFARIGAGVRKMGR